MPNSLKTVLGVFRKEREKNIFFNAIVVTLNPALICQQKQDEPDLADLAYLAVQLIWTFEAILLWGSL